MSNYDFVRSLPAGGVLHRRAPPLLHLDAALIASLLAIMAFGLLVLYSAADRNMELLINQGIRLGLGVGVLLLAAQVQPHVYLRWTPLFYAAGVLMLVLVLLVGVTVKGSQRWLDVPGLPRFQPSEVLKLAVPMMVAWYLHERPLPPGLKDVVVAALIIALPVGLIVVQPDLGTGILVGGAGFAVLVLAGLSWRWLGAAVLAAALAAPGLWYALQDYQRQRILTLFDPESDPLGAGWNIIQSTTAIGSGGLYGKGLLQGTQSHLEFLPESRTDFIIAVIGEEFGLIGVLALLALYLLAVGRGLFLATQGVQTYDRLVAGALTLTFFVYVFVNVGMVCGLLPVVGVPLPLISYGGTAMITLLAGFGIIIAMRPRRAW